MTNATLKFVNEGADYSDLPYGQFEVTPADILDTSLVGFFDAEDQHRRSLLNANGVPISSGERLASWICLKQSGVMGQTVDGSRPLWKSGTFGESSLGANDGRPGVEFDGTISRLSLTGVPASWPTGTADSEIWGIVSSSALDSDSQPRQIFGYGSNVALTARSIARSQVSSQSRFANNTGASAACSGLKHFLNVQWLVCAEYYTETAVLYADGVENGDDLTRALVAFNTATTVVVMGARVGSAASLWSPCKINSAWVVNRRTTGPERAGFEAFAAGRGITGL